MAAITLADLTANEVAAFLRHAEHERGGTIGTRSRRLASTSRSSGRNQNRVIWIRRK
ncbi:hypothetical protein [Mesorhizobium caraganae]|uniref:hypothetical protein n=1 Tax=Mesorhizobium caraganae TaxID=483206 RepID=UPI003ECC253A